MRVGTTGGSCKIDYGRSLGFIRIFNSLIVKQVNNYDHHIYESIVILNKITKSKVNIFKKS